MPHVRVLGVRVAIRRRAARRGVAGLLAIACTGCEPDGRDGPKGGRRPAAEVRDNTGIPIVENRAPVPGTRLGWVVGEKPVVSIGAGEASGAFHFHQVGDATRLPDGRIVVANGGSRELVVFDEDGGHLDSWAGEGDGPGEFRSLSMVRPWRGDSLIAGDSQEGRASIFDLTGAHGRTMSLRGPPDAVTRDGAVAGWLEGVGRGTAEPHVVVRVLPDGTLLTRTPGGFARGHHRWESEYALMDADGSPRASLGGFPGVETYSEFRERENRSGRRMFAVIPLRHPFGKTTFAAAWGDLAALGDSERYEILAYRGDGSLVRIVRRDHETRVPTQAEQDEAFRERFAGLADEDREPRMAVAANVPLVESFPAYSGLRGDALGHLWVSEFKLPDAPYEGTLWTVFGPDGVALGFVETPAGLDVLEIGADYLLGLAVDDLGVEHVQLWSLTRGPMS